MSPSLPGVTPPAHSRSLMSVAKQSSLVHPSLDAGASNGTVLAAAERGEAGVPSKIKASRKSSRLTKASELRADVLTVRTNEFKRMTGPGAARLGRRWFEQRDREELLLELYFGSLSVAEAEEIARAFWGKRAGLVRIGIEARKIARALEHWLRRELLVPQPTVFVQSVRVRQKIKGRTRHRELLVAAGGDAAGRSEVLAVCVSGGSKDDPWNRLMADLKRRGLHGLVLVEGPNEPSAWQAVARHFPEAKYQGDLAQLQRDALWMVPVSAVDSLLKAFAGIRACRTPLLAATQAARLIEELREAGEFAVALFLERTFPFQFNHYGLPASHAPVLRETSPLPAALLELRNWLRKSGPLTDERALVLMAGARLRHVFR